VAATYPARVVTFLFCFFYFSPSLRGRRGVPLDEGSAERVLHDDGEREGLSGIRRSFAGGGRPPERAHHVGEHELDVEHAERGGGADPAAGAERHHAQRPGARDVGVEPFAALQEPLRPPGLRVRPRRRVLRHPRRVELHAGVGGDAVPAQLRVPRRRVRQHEVARRVPPERLLHHRLRAWTCTKNIKRSSSSSSSSSSAAAAAAAAAGETNMPLECACVRVRPSLSTVVVFKTQESSLKARRFHDR